MFLEKCKQFCITVFMFLCMLISVFIKSIIIMIRKIINFIKSFDFVQIFNTIRSHWKASVVSLFLLFNVWLVGEMLCLEHMTGKQYQALDNKISIIAEMQEMLRKQIADVPSSTATLVPDMLVPNPKNTRAEKLIENEVYKHFKFVSAHNIDELRKRDYGVSDRLPIKIWSHHGRTMINPNDLKDTIAAVLHRLANVKSNDNLRALVFETVIAETWMGQIDYSVAAKKFKNYGLGQFRLDTAKELIKWLKTTRPDVHDQVMSFYNKKMDLRDNLLSNVPFSIAMMVEYYIHRIPNIHANISTVRKRAECWSRIYNSSKGAGSILAYERRVKKFMSQYMTPPSKKEKTSVAATAVSMASPTCLGADGSNMCVIPRKK